MRKGASMGFRWVAAFGIALLAGTAWAEEAVLLKTQKDKVSYGIGMSIGKNLKRDAGVADAGLAENGKKEGLVSLPAGLQYMAIRSGKGKTPALADTVETHYRGTLIDGTEFDSSYKRGQTGTFSVNGVIPGWTEALQKMKEGDKGQVFVPSRLAYGE